MKDKITRNIETIELPKIKLHIKKVVISLNDLNKLESKEQYELLKSTLVKIYEDRLIVDRKMVLKCVSITCSQEDTKNYLPFGLIVEKKKNKLIFRTENRKSLILLLIFINILAFLMISASYSAIDFISRKDLNKDINGDGIPDINLDLNDDGKAEINIDTNRDDKPNLNIDYKGNKKSIFNIDIDEDGKPDKNLVVKANKICMKNQVNCDTNNDGWPDTNLDLDGDGIADIDIDSDEDGLIDLNIDKNGDGTCDLNCDLDGDWKCDVSCVYIKIIEKIIEKEYINGPSNPNTDTTGDPSVGWEADNSLKVIFTDSSELIAKNVFPDDQPDIITFIPIKEFKIENSTGMVVRYNLSWIVSKNTFITDNLKFKVESTNGGGTLDYTTYPKNDHIFLSGITIAPYSTQTYYITSKLQGIGAAQNEDQGKEFIGKIQVAIENP